MKRQILLTAWLACAGIIGSVSAADWHERGHMDAHAGWVLDARHGHNHYYPPPGAAFRSLPRGYHTVHYGGAPFFFHEGIWYRRGGPGFVVARPPIGLAIDVLPPFYTTVWFGGVPYYYADDVYYRWDSGESAYVVSDPPPGNDAASNESSAPSSGDDLFAYPKNAQSKEQQATDRYECYRWASDQTGFDPTKTGGGVSGAESEGKRADYRRAQIACLEARGYSVK